jgi:hypothetical protein
MEFGMWKAALAGVTLATVGATFAEAQDLKGYDQQEFKQAYQQDFQTASLQTSSLRTAALHHGGGSITSGSIARLKAALKLRPDQQHLWPAVESALHGLMHRQARDTGSDGFVERWSNRATTAVVNADGMRRLASAAGPLIGSLDEKQKQDGMRVVRALGFADLASAF